MADEAEEVDLAPASKPKLSTVPRTGQHLEV